MEATTDFLLQRSLDMVEDDPKEAKEAFRAVAEANQEPCPSCGKRIRHRKGLGWCQDNEMSETTLQKRIMERAKRRGWRVAHAGRGYVGEGGGWITPMMKGWPDLFFMNPDATGHKVFAAELKRQTESPTPEQLDVLSLLNRCGIPAVVLRPNDLREGRVNAILEGR